MDREIEAASGPVGIGRDGLPGDTIGSRLPLWQGDRHGGAADPGIFFVDFNPFDIKHLQPAESSFQILQQVQFSNDRAASGAVDRGVLGSDANQYFFTGLKLRCGDDEHHANRGRQGIRFDGFHGVAVIERFNLEGSCFNFSRASLAAF